MPRPRPTSADSPLALVPPACRICGSTDDPERCGARSCFAKVCAAHRRICEQCGAVLCIRCSEMDLPAGASTEPFTCGACLPEAA